MVYLSNPDPYDNGTPKYSTAQAIYDGLDSLTDTEEMDILYEMFQDVSVEQQGYTYYDQGIVLKGKFDELTDGGNKMWAMDLALFKIDSGDADYNAEIHDLVYEAMIDADMAKRIGLKKLFTDQMLFGDAKQYKRVAELFTNELYELDRFDLHGMAGAFIRAMEANGTPIAVNPYLRFAHSFWEKAMRLELPEETRLLMESRALLTSYDDFRLSLSMNQELYKRLERNYGEKVLELQAAYTEKVRQLYAIAESIGALDALNGNKNLLALSENTVDAGAEQRYEAE
jgi:hypothetical protein